MLQTTIDVFYLGKMADLDPDERNYESENSEDLEGQVFGSEEAPLFKEIVKLTLNDANSSGSISADDRERTSEDLVFEGKETALDSEILVKVEITYADGSTAETTMIVL